MNDELTGRAEEIAAGFQASYDADIDLMARRDKVHVARIAQLEERVTELQSFNRSLHEELSRVHVWEPVIGENGPGIVMCRAGGELRCYRDGRVDVYEGASAWGIKLPPTVRICYRVTAGDEAGKAVGDD